jgi:phage terminase small subunit
VARPRTPTKVLELRGSFKKHPERRREREQEPEVTATLGAAPEALDEASKARWNELKKTLPWLTVADRFLVEQTCQLITLQRMGKATVAQQKLLQANLNLMGATPSGRAKVKVPPTMPKKQTNPFRSLSA